MFTNGFLTVDFGITKYWHQNKNNLTNQTLLHHAVAITGFIFSILCGYGMSGLSVVTLLCEVSSIFLNYKDMFSKEEKNTPLSQINQIMFFLTFTVFRFCLFPYLVYLVYQQINAVWNYVSIY
jgi:hypothetical protein